MAKHGKRYLEARAKVDREKLYSPGEAVAARSRRPRAPSTTSPSRCTSAPG